MQLVGAGEAVVQVWGARTRGAKGIFGIHSWIAARASGASEFTVYEVIGWRRRTTDSRVIVRKRAPDRWFGAKGKLYAEKRGAGVDMLIERIGKAVRQYPYATTYTVWPGPNSNTFTAWVARAVPELELDLPATAIGKDYTEKMVSTAASGKGFHVGLRGLIGVTASRVDGLELNILGLTFGVNASGIKLPIVGRIGAARIAEAMAVDAAAPAVEEAARS
jgi:hypothetical protein